MTALSATGLRKAYGDHLVLDGVDLDVAEGSVFALLGPNGAGKTTIVQILSTLIGADGGVLRVAGHDPARDPDAVRAAIGVTGPVRGRRQSPHRHREPAADGRPAPPRPRRGPPPRGRAPASASSSPTPPSARPPTYSGGMRRRLDIAMTLIGDPRIIFLDEPTTGLDPRSRRAMWEIVRGLVAGGVTIFLTTQYLEEADQLADRIAVLDRGQRRSPRARPEELKGDHATLDDVFLALTAKEPA